MKLNKRGSTEEFSLAQVINLVLFALFLGTLLVVGYYAYKSTKGANPDSLAVSQFERLVHDMTVSGITKTPIMLKIDADHVYELKLTNKFKDGEKKESDLEICLNNVYDTEKPKKLSCDIILGNRTETENIPLSPSFDMEIERKQPNIINLKNPTTS